MEENKEKKYQAATYTREDMPVREVSKMRKQSKIVMVLIAIPITAVILLIVWLIGSYIYSDITGPKLDKMLEYMENKYGETFEVVATDTQAWTSYYTEIKLRSEKFPDEIINEITYRDKAGKRIYRDDYMAILRRNEFNAAYQEVVGKVYKKSVVFVGLVGSGLTDTLPFEIKLDTPINDILSYPTVITDIKVYVEADERKKDEQINELRLELKKRKWDTTVDIYYMQKGSVELITLENAENILNEPERCYLYGYMLLTDNFRVSKLEWGNFK